MKGAEHAEPQETAVSEQISADLLDRMDRVDAELADDRLELSGAAGGDGETRPADEFAAILDALPGGLSGSAEPSPPAPGRGERDLNLSPVIERIRDEGPADGDAEPAAEGPVETPAGTRSGDAEEAPLPEALARPPASGAGGLRLAVILLFCLVPAAGYLFYQQGVREAALEEELRALRQSLVVLGEQQKTLEARLRAAAGRTEAESMDRAEVERMIEARAERLRREQEIFRLLALAMAARSEASAAADPAPEGKKAPEAGKSPQTAPRVAGGPAAPAKKAQRKAPAAGGWSVNLVSSGSRAQAERALERLRRKEPRVRIREAQVKGRTVFRVVVPGFASREEALRYRGRAEKELGARGAWVGRS